MKSKRQTTKYVLRNEKNKEESSLTSSGKAAATAGNGTAAIFKESAFGEQSSPSFLENLQRDSRFSAEWIAANLKALRTEDFFPLEELFVKENFFGVRGDFIIVAPYKTFRGDCEEVSLTGVIGRVIRHKQLGTKVYGQIKKLVAPVQEVIPHVIPVIIHASFGAAAVETGEAFLVPTSWGWSTCTNGPALNNLTEQARRIDDSGESALSRIWSPRSFELLMKPFRTKQKGHLVRNLEYSLHDAGHMTGYKGLFYKLSKNLLPNHWIKGFEEYRADGVDLQLAVDLYPTPLAAGIVASNVVTRFAMDAHRAGGVERDFDTVVSLLAFDRLWRSRSIRIDNGQLAFVNPTAKGLIQATEWQRRDGILISRAELQLTDETELPSLYQEFCQIADESRELFEHYVVGPCRGLYSKLR